MRSGKQGTHFFALDHDSKLVPELVLIPFVVSFNQNEKLRLGILCTLVVTALIRAKTSRSTAAQECAFLPAVAFLVLIPITFRDELYKVAALFFLVFLILYILANSITIKSAYDSLLAGIALNLVANIVGWAAGVGAPSALQRVGGLETASPFFDHRVNFPFAVSINEGPYLAACLLVAVIAMLKLRQRPRWYHWLGVLAAIFVLLASGNRTAVIFAILLGAALLLAPKVTRMVMPYVVGAGLLLPLYVGLLQPLLQYGADLLPSNSFLSRGKDVNQLVDFEGRRATWSGSIRFWTDHFPGIQPFLFGYGYQGHVKSGAYLYIPRDNSMFLRDRSALHAHNSILQAQFEVGLIGATLLLAVTVLTVYRYSRSAELLPAFAATSLIGLSGIIEPSLTPGILFVEAFMILSLAFFTPVKSARTVGPSVGNKDPGDRGLPRNRSAHPMVDLR